MPFTDRTFNKSNPGIVVVQQGDGPFSEPDVYRISNENTAGSDANNRVNEYLTAAPSDQTVGLIRMRFQVNHALEEITREGQYGLYCMGSQLNLVTGTGSCYGFVMHIANTTDWRLIRYDSGISISGQTIIEQGSVVQNPEQGKPMVMQLEWTATDLIGGINLKCQAAEGENYADLQTIYDVTLGGGLTTAVTQGILYADLEGQQSTDIKEMFVGNIFNSDYTIKAVA